MLISGSGGNFDNYIWQDVNGRNSAAWKPVIKLIVMKLSKFPSLPEIQTFAYIIYILQGLCASQIYRLGVFCSNVPTLCLGSGQYGSWHYGPIEHFRIRRTFPTDILD